MVKCTATAKSFPRGKLACGARLKRAAVGIILKAHFAANPYNTPFRPTFSDVILRPAALFRPGKPGHLPLGGRSWRQLVADTIQRGPYRTALRERKDDILPYRGRGILAGTIQPGA